MSAVRPALLVHVPAAGSRQGQAGDRTRLVSRPATVMSPFPLCLDDDSEPDLDEDEDDEDEDENENRKKDKDEDDEDDEDDGDGDGDEDEEEEETWQVRPHVGQR